MAKNATTVAWCLFSVYATKFLWDAYQFTLEMGPKMKENDYDWPKVSDFKYTVASTPAFMILEAVLKQILPPFLENYINPKTNEDIHIKREKISSAFHKLLFYVFSTTWLCKILIGKPWLPASIGGTETENLFG